VTHVEQLQTWPSELKRWFVMDTTQPLFLRLLLVDCIEIDEYSKLPPMMFVCLHTLACAARGNRCAFGGIQMLAVGDPNQIGAKHAKGVVPRYASVMDTPLWKTVFPLDLCMTLVTARRQASDLGLFHVIQRVATKSLREADIVLLRGLCRPLPMEMERYWLYPLRHQVSTRNALQIQALAQQHALTVHEYPNVLRDASGCIVPWTDALCRELRMEPVVRLCLGCPIMFLKNINPRMMLNNGSLGKVIGFHDPTHQNVFYPIFQFERAHEGGSLTQTFTYYQKPYTSTRYVHCIKQSISVTGLGLVVCFAMTIDKSQGKTLPAVVTVLNDSLFSEGQDVVALSRTARASALQIEDFNERWVRTTLCPPSNVPGHIP
jgi:hypothetical protein